MGNCISETFSHRDKPPNFASCRTRTSTSYVASQSEGCNRNIPSTTENQSMQYICDTNEDEFQIMCNQITILSNANEMIQTILQYAEKYLDVECCAMYFHDPRLRCIVRVARYRSNQASIVNEYKVFTNLKIPITKVFENSNSLLAHVWKTKAIQRLVTREQPWVHYNNMIDISLKTRSVVAPTLVGLPFLDTENNVVAVLEYFVIPTHHMNDRVKKEKSIYRHLRKFKQFSPIFSVCLRDAFQFDMLKLAERQQKAIARVMSIACEETQEQVNLANHTNNSIVHAIISEAKNLVNADHADLLTVEWSASVMSFVSIKTSCNRSGKNMALLHKVALNKTIHVVNGLDKEYYMFVPIEQDHKVVAILELGANDTKEKVSFTIIEQEAVLNYISEVQSVLQYAQPTVIINQPLIPLLSSNSVTSLLSWEFNVFAIDEANLPAYVNYMFLDYKFLQTLSVDIQTVQNFIYAVKANYHPNPFHNFRHAFSVAHAAYLLLKTTKMSVQLSALEICAAMIACLCHDVDHPGHGNGFEVATESRLAIRYGDDSVLERHHIAKTFEILRTYKNANILQNLTSSEYKYTRRLMNTAILGTDMSQHFTFCDTLKQEWLDPATGRASHSSFNNDDAQRLLLITALVHTSDLSGQVFPLPIALKWSNRISEEFAAQANAEKEAGLPISHPDLSSPSIMVKNQLIFAEKIVYPLWDTICQAYPETEICLTQLKGNIKHYTEELERLEDVQNIDLDESSSSVMVGLAMAGGNPSSPAKFNSFRVTLEDGGMSWGRAEDEANTQLMCSSDNYYLCADDNDDEDAKVIDIHSKALELLL